MMRPVIDRLLPMPPDSGFRQEGYFVWGGSLIRVAGLYHLFASRWPEGTGDPDDLVGILDGYRRHSEIVRATAGNPLGPYEFEEVVLAGRGERRWDGQSCHGPKIVKAGGRYVLYYQGIACGSRLRKVGYAWADAIEGPWHRCDREVPLSADANNPAPYVRPDGSVLLAYKKKGGGAGGGYGGQGMGWLGANPGGFGHEYGHGMSIQWRVGDGEILAQSMMELTDNRCTSYDHNTQVPWRNCVHAEYNSCLFYRTIGYDPNWGLLAVTAMPASK